MSLRHFSRSIMVGHAWHASLCAKSRRNENNFRWHFHDWAFRGVMMDMTAFGMLADARDDRGIIMKAPQMLRHHNGSVLYRYSTTINAPIEKRNDNRMKNATAVFSIFLRDSQAWLAKRAWRCRARRRHQKPISWCENIDDCWRRYDKRIVIELRWPSAWHIGMRHRHDIASWWPERNNRHGNYRARTTDQSLLQCRRCQRRSVNEPLMK